MEDNIANNLLNERSEMKKQAKKWVEEVETSMGVHIRGQLPNGKIVL